MQRITLALALSLAASACNSTKAHDPADPKKRAALLDKVKSLEGTWEGTDASAGVTEFKVCSGGTAVREIMALGTRNEMTNMYRLEGNELVVTHYCAMGNQPEMHASSPAGNQLMFVCDHVSDLDTPDEAYMGGLTLVFADHDHLRELWSTCVKGEIQKGEPFTIALTRRK